MDLGTSSHKKGRLGIFILIFLLIFLIIGFPIAGCSRVPKQGTPGGAAPAVIEIWHTLQGDEADLLAKQVQRVMDQHPEVIIRLKNVPEDQIATLTYQAEAGGEGPEIFIASRETLTKMYNQGALAPVAATSDAFTGLVAPFRYGDKVYAQPWLTDLPVLYYRKDVVQPPGSFTDWMTAKGILAVPALNTGMISTWWTSQGGKLTAGGRPVLDDPANLAFLQQLMAWRDSKLMVVDPNAQARFASGQAVYTIGWAGQAPALTKANIPWGSVPLAGLVGGQGQGLPGPILGIANSSIKTTDALASMIKTVEEALLSPEIEGAFAQAGTRFPASVAYYKTAEGQKGLAPQVAQGLGKLWTIDGNALEQKLLPLQDAAWQSAWGGTAPQDALTQAQAQAVKVAAGK